MNRAFRSAALSVALLGSVFALAPLAHAAKSSAPLFSRNLGIGSIGSDVTALQEFLNGDGFTIASSGPGSPSNETDYFGTLTKLALIQFQDAYATSLLAPLGLTQGTGNFFAATRRFVNELLASQTASSTSSVASSANTSTSTTILPDGQQIITTSNGERLLLPKIVQGAPASSGGYYQSSAPSLITPVITFSNITATYGNAPITLAATSTSSGAFTYTSSNPSVATISGSTATIIGAGVTTITATEAASGNYASAAASSVLTVNPIAPTIEFDSLVEFLSDVIGPITLNATSTSGGSFTFNIANQNIGTISGNMCTLLTAGTTTITATQAASGNYGAESTTTEIDVYANECAVGNPCNGNGICIPGFRTFSCECNPPYTGPTCDQTQVLINPAA